MAGPVELRGIDPRRLGEPIESVVPRQRVRPLVQKALDGLFLSHPVIEPYNKPVRPPDALSEDGVGQP